MKPFIILFVCMGFVGGLFYVGFAAGGMFDMNPEKQANIIRSQVKQGMTWKEVADINQPKYVVPYDFSLNSGETAPIKWDDFITRLKGNRFPNGFAYDYRITGAIHFRVEFSKRGICRKLVDMKSTKDLFNGTLFVN